MTSEKKQKDVRDIKSEMQSEILWLVSKRAPDKLEIVRKVIKKWMRDKPSRWWLERKNKSIKRWIEEIHQELTGRKSF